MRTIPTAMQNYLNQNVGTEPILVAEIEWVDGTPIPYSDQDLDGASTRLIEVDGFDISRQLEGSSDSQTITITLDDVDGSIREIYKRVNTHRRTAALYLLFKGQSLSDKVLLIDGYLVTPLNWPENERNVSFTLLSKASSLNVGFSMEEGDFPNIPEEALGKAWPLVFGQVCWLPAVKVRAPRRGYLLRGEMIPDFTLEPRICQALRIQCPSQYTGEAQMMLDGEYVKADTVAPDNDCVNRRFGEICKLRDLQTQQNAYVHNTLSIYNGVSFPQGTRIAIKADGATFWGSFSGNTFTVTARQHKDYADWDHQECVEVDSPRYGTRRARYFVTGWCGMRGYSLRQGGFQGGQCGTGNTQYEWGPTDETQVAFRSNATSDQEFESCDEALTSSRGGTGGPVDSWSYYDAMEEAGYQWIRAGTDVYVETEAEELHIVSLIPGTVDAVAAFRTAANGQRYLTEVPSSYYTIYETDYDGYTVVEIGLEKSLSLFDDGWEDQLYVSFTSDEGPNTCDIIEWIIEKYTDLTVDASSFASVRTLLANYPQNFYLLDRPDALELCIDLAYQARCALYIRNGTIYIKYLAYEPTSVRTLTTSDILAGTFSESLTESDEVYTHHKISWSKAGAAVRDDLSPDRQLRLKYNMDIYGNQEKEWDYYSYNVYSLVLKSGTFWLIRKANAWRTVTFDLPLKHIDLDVGDCVTLDIPYFSSAVKVVIERCNYIPNDNKIQVTCWTPIRAGEDAAYYWAWPSQKPAVARWPLPDDTHGGGGYNFTVSPPIGHLLLGGSDHEDQIIISSGDRNPSDLDDSFPTVDCEILDYIEFNEVEPAIEAKQIAQSAARSSYENTMSGGGNPGGVKNKRQEQSTCGQVEGGCGYKVIITWHTSRSQGNPTNPAVECGGPCACVGGCPSCFGSTWQVCHTWTSAGGASAFGGYMESQYGKSISDHWDCNETAIIAVHTPSTPVNNSPDGQCPGSPGGGEQVGSGIGATGNELGAGQETGGENTLDSGDADGEFENQTSFAPE